ncbi:unnamed protein product, partial [Urochloa humidicola]
TAAAAAVRLRVRRAAAAACRRAARADDGVSRSSGPARACRLLGLRRARSDVSTSAVQLCAPLQQCVDGLHVQMMVSAGHLAHPVPAAYQAFAMLEAAALIDVQDEASGASIVV